MRAFLSTLFISLLLVLNYLNRNCYAFYRPEALFLWLFIFIFLLLSLLVCRALKVEWLLYAFLLILVTDMAFGFVEWFYGLAKNAAGNKAAGYATMGMVIGAILFLFYKARKAVGRFFMQGAAAALVSAVLLGLVFPRHLYSFSPGTEAARPSNGKPDIFFIILDEHIGPAGIPDVGPVSARVREDLRRRYSHEGFTLYEKAYSNYTATLDSIPSVLNAKIYSRRRADVKDKILLKNKLFEKMSRQGYRINIYQGTHPDYSRSADFSFHKRFTYQSTATGYLQSLPLGIHEKIRVLFIHFIGSGKSEPIKKIIRFFTGGSRTHEDVMLGALAADRVLEQMKEDLRAEKNGTFFFAHLMIPHSSYVYDAGGGLLKPGQWEESGSPDEEVISAFNTVSSRMRKYPLYLGQIAALHKKLAGLFEAMKEAGVYDRATIVLMADHGSRIFLTVPTEQNRGRLTARDFIDGYSAFLAVKKGDFSSPLKTGTGISETKIPLIKVIGEFFETLPEASESLYQVYLQTDDPSFFASADMPDF